MQRSNRLGVALVCVWSTVMGLFAQQAEEAVGRPASRGAESAKGAVPDGLNAADWSGIRAVHEATRHAVVAVGDGLRAHNPGQRWGTHFDRRGFTIQPDARGWAWGLTLVRYGFAGHEQEVAAPTWITARDQCVAYHWDAMLTEWYVNAVHGLEHGYTVLRQPPQACGGALTFTLAVSGGLRPRVQDDGRGVCFTNRDGATVLSYTGLTVLDARGRELPARFRRAAEGLFLSIDERSARYPLTIESIAQRANHEVSNTETNDRFGNAVAVSGGTVVVGALFEDSAATGVNGEPHDNHAPWAGAAYVFVRSGTTWTQQACLKASNTEAFDLFGSAVAISGDTVVIGAHDEDSKATGVDGNQRDDSAPGAGAAYVFVRNGTTWAQQAYLKASNTAPGDRFGAAVAVSGDTVVVGAFREASSATGVDGDQGDDSAIEAGAAYVFVRGGANWTQQAYLKAANTAAGENFACSVTVSGDTVVVGARGGDSNSGAAYVFVRSGATWTQEACLEASNTAADDNFGWSVAVSGDTVVVGAPGTGSNATDAHGDYRVVEGGAAYVFVRSGTTWTQQGCLEASNPGLHDHFGASVAVSGDTVVIAARNEASSATGVDGDQDDNRAIDAGAAYVFVRSGTSWTRQVYLKASNTEAHDLFGTAVSVSGDTVVVGAPLEDSDATGVDSDQGDNSKPDAGAAYAFARSGTTWAQQAYLKEWDTAAGVNGNPLDDRAVGSGLRVSPATPSR